MKQRTMDEMITYFNQEIVKMDIDRKYKVALFGMIAAIGYQNKKQESSAEHEPGHWIKRFSADNLSYYECSECGAEWLLTEGTPKNNKMNYCPKCGARMEGQA